MVNKGPNFFTRLSDFFIALSTIIPYIYTKSPLSIFFVMNLCFAILLSLTYVIYFKNQLYHHF